MKIVFIIFSAALLIYMLWPGPTKISDFKPLPESAKSTLSGDTVQIPNVAGFFSNHFRNFVISFYKNDFQERNFSPFPPVVLNHPPEYSWQVIKKHTDSTYLEEFVYPLRSSLFVNGMELYRPDGTLIFHGAPYLEEEGKYWFTKATLRFYPSSFFIKLIVWWGIIASVVLLFKLGRRIAKE